MVTSNLPSESAAEAAARADREERDRKAWNLPRGARARRASDAGHRDGLDWDEFRDLYYPNSRRHTLEAIVTYGDYKRASKLAEHRGNAS